MINKPGWIRFNVHYSFTDNDLDYLIDALEFTVENCRKIESYFYEINEEGGYSVKLSALGIQKCHSLHSLASSMELNILNPLIIDVCKEEDRAKQLNERKQIVAEFLKMKSK